MNTIFSMIKKSYELSDIEKRFLKIYFDYMRNHIPNGDGSYLATFDFDKILFKYSPNLVINESDVLGYWTPLFNDSIFLRPSLDSENFKNVAKTMIDKDDQKYETYCEILKKNENLTYIFKKPEEFKNILYLVGESISESDIESDIIPVVTVLHELYHKWQFTSAKIPYIFNLFVSIFFGYELASKLSFLVEGDVRKHVDNKQTRLISAEFSKFFNIIQTLNFSLSMLHSLKSKVNKGNLSIKDQLENLEMINNFKLDVDEKIKNLKNIDKIVYKICLKFVKDEDLLINEVIKLIEQ